MPIFVDSAQGVRDRRVDLYGSPNFRHVVATLAAGGGAESVDVQVTIPRSRKYEPLTSMEISNNGAANLDLEINGKTFISIPAGVIKTISDRPIWSFRLVNNDSVQSTTPLVTLVLWSPPMTADRASRRGI